VSGGLAWGVLKAGSSMAIPSNLALSAARCFRVFTGWARTSVLVVAISGHVACGSDQGLFRGAPGAAGEAGADQEGGGGGGAAEAPAGAAAGGAGAEAEAAPSDAPLFDPLRVIEVELTLSPEDWDAVRLQTRGVDLLAGADCQSQPFENPFTYVHAEVVVDGVKLTDVGLRKKGFLGSLDENKPSLKIALAEFVEQDLLGAKDITLNNAKQDPSYLNQCLGYMTFDAAGVPASRCNFAHVTVNGQDLGLYVHVEAIKKPMLRRHFASDEGNLYEGTLSDFREGWLGTFEKKTNESDPARPELDAVTAAAAASESELLPSLEAVLDFDEFISFWAAEVLLQHGDGYAGNTNNFYVYGDPTTSKVSILPWGIDNLFSRPPGTAANPETILTTGVLARRLWESSAGRARFEARLRELLDSIWKPSLLAAEADRMVELVEPFLSAGEQSAQASAVAQLKRRMAARRASLLAALDAPPAPLPAPRGLVCFRELGTVSGTFTTTWGSNSAEDPFAAGEATLAASVDGEDWVLNPDYVTAVAGPDQDPASAFPASVGVLALRDDGMLGLLYFGLKSEQIKPGDVSLNLETAASLLFDADPDVKDVPPTLRAAVFGTIHFDSAATTPGAPVTGSYQGTLFASGLLGIQ
jgi:hypothetical protein